MPIEPVFFQPRRFRTAPAQMNRSFLVLFFKKEPLSFFYAHSRVVMDF
jgi:hypothetical protein